MFREDVKVHRFAILSAVVAVFYVCEHQCQQVNVYGPVTEGMWAEIHRANKLDIPVVTDLKTKGRTSPRRKKSAKREEVK